ncbi:MAG: polymerase, partial [Chloroflexota bacterium]
MPRRRSYPAPTRFAASLLVAVLCTLGTSLPALSRQEATPMASPAAMADPAAPATILTTDALGPPRLP